MKRNWKFVTALLLFVVAFFGYTLKRNKQAVSRVQRRTLTGTRLPASDADEAKRVFRFQTFGSEAFWSDALKLHQAILGADLGGVGPGLSVRNALALGLKIDSRAISDELAERLKEETAGLDDPGTMLDLLQSNAVVGLVGTFDNFLFFRGAGKLKTVGTSCAFCHSTVDDSVMPGVGRRLDGWPNRDLNVGAIISLAADLGKISGPRGADDAALRGVLNSWGPGRMDPQLALQNANAQPLPSLFGPVGGTDWNGPALVTHWNAFIPQSQARGVIFFNLRSNDLASQIAALRSYQQKLAPPAKSDGAPAAQIDADGH
jgi:hypothetical protein